MKNKIKKIVKLCTKLVNIILIMFVLLMIPVMAFLLISSKTDKIGGIKSFVVLSGSMSPNIPVGSVILTTPKLVYENGDIVTFTKGGNTITHRIVERKATNGQAIFITKGDANNKNDEGEIFKNQIIGSQIFVIPYIGRFTAFLFTSFGFILFIVFPVFLFILFELYNIKKELEKQIKAKYLEKMKNQNINL